jgi:hypothetical protein
MDVLTDVGVREYILPPLEQVFGRWFVRRGSLGMGLTTMVKRYDEEVRVERDAGMPSVFEWRGRRYQVVDVIGKWKIEGRWWEDGREREYWRVEAKGGAVWDLYHDRSHDRWHMERLWD